MTPARRPLALALAAAITLAVSACSDPNPPYTDRGALRTYLEQAPGVPLVLPTSLPKGYVFLGPGFEQSENDRMYVRSTDYRVDVGSGSTVVEVCLTEPARPRATCVPPESTQQTVERTFGAYPVWIRPLGTAALTDAERTFWSTVPLSDDLTSVDWLT